MVNRYRIAIIVTFLFSMVFVPSLTPHTLAQIACSSFAYRSDIEAITNVLGTQYRLVSDGETCAAGANLQPIKETTPNRQERLNGSSTRSKLPDDVQELKVELDGSASGIGLKEDKFGPDSHFSVRLAGIADPDAANRTRQCYGTESRTLFNQLLADDTTVWLQRDQTKDSDRSIGDTKDAVGYLWVEASGGKYQLVNMVLVEKGAAVVAIVAPDEYYAGDLRAAQERAIDKNTGLWKACRSDGALSRSPSSSSTSIVSPVADCTPFASYEIAQQYYANHSDEQPVIDPDNDGYACEVFFGVDPTAGTVPDQGGAFIGSGSNDGPAATEVSVEPPAVPSNNSGGGLPPAAD